MVLSSISIYHITLYSHEIAELVISVSNRSLQKEEIALQVIADSRLRQPIYITYTHTNVKSFKNKVTK